MRFPILRLFDADTNSTGQQGIQISKILQNAIDIVQLFLITRAVWQFVTSHSFLVLRSTFSHFSSFFELEMESSSAIDFTPVPDKCLNGGVRTPSAIGPPCVVTMEDEIVQEPHQGNGTEAHSDITPPWSSIASSQDRHEAEHTRRMLKGVMNCARSCENAADHCCIYVDRILISCLDFAEEMFGLCLTCCEDTCETLCVTVHRACFPCRYCWNAA